MSFDRQIDVGNSSVLIKQQLESDVNGVIWDSALVTIHYLSKNAHLVKGKKVLELGSGTGAVSIVCGMMGANAIATDLPARLDLINKNNLLNKDKMAGNVEVEGLDWNDGYRKMDSVDLLIAVDCVYYMESVDPLIKTIKGVKANKTLIAYEKRDIGEPMDAQERFMKQIGDQFILEEVSKDELDEFACDDIHLFFLSHPS
ncbi:hypothetical protein PFISCL1PPCAC_15682 [Pristionchus fissidentatus]|uniref:Methyltransferase n=1 Tax=Pristionchus fissidentatus TaxID=1538716 RepID=A0AAV5W0Z4_9BILA|nr:hypothetical protein PFISCL1PPCAC_3946 [Pristionchus fissidentatus]GMT24385.1 hypothetical protein PFISCL1PPCAC_15682 [Pristionchus fissidentatus]